MMRYTVACIFLLSVALIAHSQCEMMAGPPNIPNDGDVIDGVVMLENVLTKRLMPYEYVREADLIWSKRVWRSIDMREKMNLPIYLPWDEFSPDGQVWNRNSSRWSLWTILRANIMCANLQPYYPFNPIQQSSIDGDQFKYPIPVTSGNNYYTDSLYAKNLVEFQVLGAEEEGALIPIASRLPPYEDSVIEMTNGDLLVQYEPRKIVWVTSKDIIEYRVKEDWFFDKERSVLDVRILGIAPVVYKKTSTGQVEGTRELFWLYFPECRFILNNYFVYNPKNDAQWMSFDDFFWKRQFSSSIYKQSNTFDRKIESYRRGVDALMESEKITDEIRTLEHDLWHF